MQDIGMKQEHGGGDDIEYDEEAVEKKLKLEKYLHAADFNLSDVFERIIRAYLNKEDANKILEKVKYERMALLRAGIRAMQRGLPHLNLSKNRIAYYLVKMLLDQEWNMAFKTLMRETYNPQTKFPIPLIVGMNKAYEEYGVKLTQWITDLIMDLNNEEILSLIHEMHCKELVNELKKHLILIARDDIGKNKNNAIHALVNLMEEDERIVKLMVLILKRPDQEAHGFVLHALSVRKGKTKNKDLIEEIKKLDSKTRNPHIKHLIKRILG